MSKMSKQQQGEQQGEQQGDPSTERRVAGVVLAAGRSSRLTGAVPKQLLDFAGQPLVRRAVHTALAAGLSEVVVVLGHRAEEVKAALHDLHGPSGLLPSGPLRTVLNPHFADGQSTSVRCGLAAVSAAATAALFVPIDQPFLTSALINRLVAAHGSGADIAQPTAAGRQGAPVLFARRYFPDLERLTGDTGGRALLAAHRSNIQWVPARERELLDIDTAEDLCRLQALATR